jgi:uncharacterized protein
MQAQLEASQSQQTDFLQIDIEGKVQLTLNDLIGSRIAILGISGSGKTNTVAVLLEGMLERGLPMTILDPEGEYWGLREKFQLVIAGRGKRVDLELESPDQARQLAKLSHQEGFSVILDVSGLKKAAREELIFAYMESLWESAEEVRKPYEVVLEEAHLFVPERGKSALLELLDDLASRGRKRGLGTILSSQRSAKVSKDFLTQAEGYFLQRVVHPSDMSVYKDLIPLASKEVEETVGRLGRGQAVYLKNHVPQVVQIKERDTYHPGATPELDAKVAAKIEPLDVTSLVKKLAVTAPSSTTSVAKTNSTGGAADADKKLKAENERLKVEIENLEKFRTFADEQLTKIAKERDAALARVRELEKALSERERVAPPVVSSQPAPAQAAARPVAPAPSLKPAATNQKRSELLPAERKRLEMLKRRLGKLGTTERRILNVLYLRPDNAPGLCRPEIARRFGWKPNSGSGSLWTKLANSGFVTRSEFGGSLIYKSNLQAVVAEEFPDTDPKIILPELEKLLD